MSIAFFHMWLAALQGLKRYVTIGRSRGSLCKPSSDLLCVIHGASRVSSIALGILLVALTALSQLVAKLGIT